MVHAEPMHGFYEQLDRPALAQMRCRLPVMHLLAYFSLQVSRDEDLKSHDCTRRVLPASVQDSVVQFESFPLSEVSFTSRRMHAVMFPFRSLL